MTYCVTPVGLAKPYLDQMGIRTVEDWIRDLYRRNMGKLIILYPFGVDSTEGDIVAFHQEELQLIKPIAKLRDWC